MEENITPVTPASAVGQNNTASDSWQIENLIRMSWNRTADRFVSYFLAIVLSVVIFVGVFVIGAVVAGILIAIFAALSLSNLGLVSVLLIVLVSLVVLLILLYVGSLINLLINEVMIQETKTGVMETLAKVRPLVWDYVWVTSFMSLFFVGLLIWGVLSLGSVFILWSVWSSFVTFVFLEKRKRGLANLWMSKALVDQRFWGIVGRLVLLNAAAFLISSILAGSKNSVLEFGSLIASLIVQPFMISFGYEMYRNIPEPQNVKRPGVWVGFSAAGWALLILMVVVLGNSLVGLLKDFSPQELMNIYKSAQNVRGTNRLIPKSVLPEEFNNYLPENLPLENGEIPSNTL